MGYYLTDGIYPNWATFIQGFNHPQTDKQRLFAAKQSAARKDVGRAFGVLQARFAIIRKLSLAWDEDVLSKIINACIILYNMIVEDERHAYVNEEDSETCYEDHPTRRARREASISAPKNADEPFQFRTERPFNLDAYLSKRDSMRDRNTHVALKSDLMDHIWHRYGPNNQ